MISRIIQVAEDFLNFHTVYTVKTAQRKNGEKSHNIFANFPWNQLIVKWTFFTLWNDFIIFLHWVPVIVLWEWPVDRGYLDIVVQHKLWIPGTIGDWEHLEFDVFALLAFASLRQRFWRPQQPLQPLWETFVFKERKLKIISKNTIVCIQYMYVQYMHPKFA